MDKRPRRSESNKSILGVAAGLAEYFDIEVGLVRAGFVLAAIFTAVVPTLIVYGVLAFVMSPEGSPAEKLINDGLEQASGIVGKAADKIETMSVNTGNAAGKVVDQAAEKQPDIIIDNNDDFLS